MSDDDDDGAGYRKPPRRTRFRAGKSGNPKGRPKGSKNIATIAAKVAAMKIPITHNGKKKNVPLTEALLLGMAHDAAKGSKHDRKNLLEYLTKNAPVDNQAADETPLTEEDKAILADEAKFFELIKSLATPTPVEEEDDDDDDAP